MTCLPIESWYAYLTNVYICQYNSKHVVTVSDNLNPLNYRVVCVCVFCIEDINILPHNYIICLSLCDSSGIGNLSFNKLQMYAYQ